MDKKTLRKNLIERRERIPAAEAEAAAAAAAEKLFATFFYYKARTLFVFISVGNEPDTAPIIMRALADGKTVCVPRTSAGRRLEAVPIEADGKTVCVPRTSARRHLEAMPIEADGKKACVPRTSAGRRLEAVPIEADGKKACVPRTSAGRRLEAVPIEGEAAFAKAFADWPRSYGIPEPPAHIPAVNPAALDLVIVPSLAVDRRGYRIGYGGGYYDEFIAGFGATRKQDRFGLRPGGCYDTFAASIGAQEKRSSRFPKNRPVFAALQYGEFLLGDPLPREPHDMPVDVIVTENGLLAPNWPYPLFWLYSLA